MPQDDQKHDLEQDIVRDNDNANTNAANAANVEDAKTSSAFDADVIKIVDEELGEEYDMTCTDDLDVVEETYEYIDNDAVYQFTDEQIALALLDILSFDDRNVVAHKSFWNQRVREFLQVLKRQENMNTDDETSWLTHPFVIPVVKARKVIVENDAVDTNDRYTIPLSQLLSERVRLNTTSTEPFTKMLPKLVKLERIWKQLNDDSLFSKSLTIAKAMPAYVYGHDNSLQRVCLDVGDVVDIVGFVFVKHPNDTIDTFVTSDYLKSLASLNIHDSITFIHQTNDNTFGGKVIAKNNDDVVCEIKRGQDTENVVVSLQNPWDNDVMLYPNSYDGFKWTKNSYMDSNVFVTIPPNAALAVFNKFIPTFWDVVRIGRISQSPLNLAIYEELFLQWGLDINSINSKAWNLLREYIQRHVQNLKHQRKKKGITIAPLEANVKELSESCVLDFDKYSDALREYPVYKFANTFVDSARHRIKYLSLQQDDGLYFVTCLIDVLCDKMYDVVNEQKTKYEKELNELASKMERLSAVRKQCTDYTPVVKKTYSDVSALESDNFKPLDGIKVGDYAMCNHHIYRRVSTSDGVQFWSKSIDNGVGTDQCNEKGDIPAFDELQKSDGCVYDDISKLCENKAFLETQNTINNMRERKETIEKLLQFHKLHGGLKQARAQELKDIAVSLHYAAKTRRSDGFVSFDASKDYSHFVGHPDDFQDRYAEAEQGENVFYAVLNPTKDAQDGESSRDKGDTDAGFHELDTNESNTTKAFFINFINYAGIRLARNIIEFVIANVEYYVDVGKLTKDLDRLYKTANQNMEKSLQEILKNNPSQDKQIILKKLRKQRDEQIAKFKKSIKQSHNKNTVLHVCALYVLVVQANITSIEIATTFQGCEKKFSLEGFPLNNNEKSLISYLACVVKGLATPNDPLLSTFADMTIPVIAHEIREVTTKVLLHKTDMASEIQAMSVLHANQQNKERKIQSTEWTGFKPNMKIGALPQHVPYYARYLQNFYNFHQSPEHRIEKITRRFTFTKSFEDAGHFKELERKYQDTIIKVGEGVYRRGKRSPTKMDLFEEKEIVQHHKSILFDKTIDVKLRENQKGNVNANVIANVDIPLRTTMQQCVDNKSEQWWNDFTDKIHGYLDDYTRVADEMGLNNSETMTKCAEYLLFHEKKQTDLNRPHQTLRVLMAFEQFLTDTIKTLMSKITNNWVSDFKLLNQKYKKMDIKDDIVEVQQDDDLQSLVAKLKSFDPQVQTLWCDSMKSWMKVFTQTFPLMTTQMDNSKRLYMYAFSFLYLLFSIVQTSLGNKVPNPFLQLNVEQIQSRSETKRQFMFAMELNEFFIRRFVKSMNNNTFDTMTINKRNEELREQRKLDIIRRLEKLTDDNRKMALQLQKMNLISWADIGNEENEAPPIEQPVEVDVSERNNINEEAENDELVFKGHDRDEQDNDEYMSDDELIQDEY